MGQFPKITTGQTLFPNFFLNIWKVLHRDYSHAVALPVTQVTVSNHLRQRPSLLLVFSTTGYMQHAYQQ